MNTLRSVALVVVPFAALAACSSATVVATPSDAGSSDSGGKLVVPRVTLDSELGPGVESGVNDTAKCQLTKTPWVVIGDATHPVSDGDTQTGTKVTVACRVAAEAGGFTVSAKASLGLNSVQISGHFENQGVQPNIHAVFSRGDTGTFAEDDCTARYTTGSEGVAAGRVWAVLDCPHAVLAAQDRTCLGTAEFKFENCTQE